tara:strand:- start:365 stop:1444 length:1080 start_codon:yes stop_codon:yes gene_type:complete
MEDILMAFTATTGHGNLPNGNFSSEIYSRKVQLAFRKSTVVGDITNSEYFGEIAAQGDTVKIIKEPEISVSEYKRGTTVTAQDLDDEEFSLVIDKANYFAFKMDDIEEAHSHVNFMDLATSRAAYRLADNHDQEVLSYMAGVSRASGLHSVGAAESESTDTNGVKAVSTAGSNELLSSMTLDNLSFFGDDGSGDGVPITARKGSQASNTISPVTMIARMNRLLDQQQVDKADRWCVVDPVFMEILQDEDSRFFDSDFGQNGGLRNGLAVNNILGMRMYVSSNLPAHGNGPGTSTATHNDDNYGILLAGHGSAVATAEQINKTETYRDPDSFADIVRGMHLYGRKILRPEALIRARYHSA